MTGRRRDDGHRVYRGPYLARDTAGRPKLKRAFPRTRPRSVSDTWRTSE